MKILETERLILRKWNLEKDLEPWTAITQDPVVMEYFYQMGDEKASIEFINRMNKLIDEKGYGLFACDLKETREFIGFIGLSIPSFQTHFTPCVEIGWRLAHKFWGKGYAPEGARAVIAMGLKQYGLSEIVSFTAKNNLNSRKAMEKIGMSYDENDDFNHPLLPTDHDLSLHVLYRLKNNLL